MFRTVSVSCRVLFQIIFEKLVILVGFVVRIYKKVFILQYTNRSISCLPDSFPCPCVSIWQLQFETRTDTLRN